MAIVLEIKVVPASGRQEWVLDKSGILKCFVKSPAQKNKANQELIKLLSKDLNISQHALSIVRGTTSRKKQVRIEKDLSFENILSLLGIERQVSMFS